jgi:hypothetical protein
MTTVNVKYIANGFTVNWQGSAVIGVPASLYAASVPEVIYWLGRVFDPVNAPPAQRSVAPRAIVNTDPLLGQQANVIDIASGGFLVTQLPSAAGNGVQMIETYAPTMDAVSDLLTQIFTAPALDEQAQPSEDPGVSAR